MKTQRFEFNYDVPMGEVELTYNLALFAAEGFVGRTRLRLEVAHRVDTEGHAMIVEGHDEAFDAVVRVFASLLAREFGESAFRVRPVAAKREPVAA